MKKIMWKTEPSHKDSTTKKYVAACDGKEMCNMFEFYAEGILMGWRLWLPTGLPLFINKEAILTVARAKKHAEYIMRKMAETFAPLAEVEK